MRIAARASWPILAALLLPLLTFLGLQVAFAARDQRRTVEADAIARTERIVAAADSLLARTLGALDAAAVGRAVVARDWAGVDPVLREIASQSRWRTALLIDLAERRTLIDLRRPFGAPRPAPPIAAPDGGWPAAAFVGGIVRGGAGCPCALVHRVVREGGTPRYLIIAALDPGPFLRLLQDRVESDDVGAIVDRRGLFVARTLEPALRVGTRASRYVQEAVRGGGGGGIYSGVTLEGFVSYTAFSRSSLSGWSAHVAFRPGLLDPPRAWSLGATAGAALASLLLALLLIWFGLRQLAEARRVQERWQEAQKMEALGHVTGGIAHDFNNLLTPIIGGLDMISRRAALAPPLQGMADSALASARRAAKLTAQLLAFSRRQKMQIGPVDLERLLADIRPLLDQSVGPMVRIETRIRARARYVRSDVNQLELALLNLALNARDAMPQGGPLRIEAEAEDERWVALSVTDSGNGMAPEVRARALEPFFTTKSSGKGTGLGLAQVYGTVEQSGGRMTIEDAPGGGVSVRLLLPASPAPVETERAVAPPPAAVDQLALSVILCDDDDAVRASAAAALGEAGWSLVSVADGPTALQALRAETDLLIVDFAMPGMNGAEVIAAARAKHPDLPVLLITGYADSAAIDGVGADIAILRKPFGGEELRAAARAAIKPPAAD